MAIASANAEAISIGTNTFPEASGLRPIASIAFEPIIPIAIAGAIDPRPIAIAFASVEISIDLIELTYNNKGINLSLQLRFEQLEHF